ncbi:6-phosphogluconolactonase [Apiospora saccharicola]
MSRPGPVKSRQDKPHPNAIFPDPTQGFLLVPDLGADVIRIFAVDPDFGTLTPCRPAKTGDGGGPRHGAFYQTAGNASTVLYIFNELSNTVSVWTLENPPATDRDGCLSLTKTKTQTISTFAPGTSAPSPNAKAAEVHVRDNHLYASNRDDQLLGRQQDSIAHYTIDPATGALTWGEAANAHAWCPTTFDINRNGTLVAVGGQATAKVVILERDPATGKSGEDAVAVGAAIGYGGSTNAMDGFEPPALGRVKEELVSSHIHH